MDLVWMQDSEEHRTQPSQEIPSLVARLQHLHGIQGSKKKPSGGKSAQKSFFSDERVSPNSNNDDSCPLPLTNSGGRAPSLSKMNRATRIAQAGGPEVFPRRSSFPRKNSRLSAYPELPSSGPPSSQSPSNPSPVSPMSEIYPASYTAAPHDQQMQADPSGLHSPYQTNQNDYLRPVDATVPLTVLSNVGAASCGGNSTVSTDQYNNNYTNHAQGSSSPPTSLYPEDDEPFTFDASYVAATAELWENEVIPVYPDVPSMKATSTTSTATVKVDPPRTQSSQNTFYIPEPINVTPGTTLPNPSWASSHETYPTLGALQSAVPANDDRRQTDMNVYHPTFSWSSSSSLIGWAG